MKFPGLVLLIALLPGPAALAQSVPQLPPYQAGDTARTPGLTGLDSLLVIGRPLGAIIGPLQAGWRTTVQLVPAVPAGRPDSVQRRILELRDAAQDPLYQVLRRCPAARVFVLPYYPLPSVGGQPGPALRGLYLVFYHDTLTRIWSPEPRVIARQFEQAYGFGPGFSRRVYGPAGRHTDRTARRTFTGPGLITSRRRWHNGDVEAGAYELYELRGDQTQQSFLIKSRRLDAALTRCQGLTPLRP